MQLASHLARLGTTPCCRQAKIGGPNLGCCNSQRSNAGQPLPAAKADNNTKGTVGKPGNSTPSNPSSKLISASVRQAIVDNHCITIKLQQNQLAGIMPRGHTGQQAG